jgi:hypothetical protein
MHVLQTLLQGCTCCDPLLRLIRRCMVEALADDVPYLQATLGVTAEASVVQMLCMALQLNNNTGIAGQ